MSPALSGRLLSTVPPGSPTGWFFKTYFPLIKKVIIIVGVYVSKTHSVMSFYYRLSHMELSIK